jgi:hypothetical protein
LPVANDHQEVNHRAFLSSLFESVKGDGIVRNSDGAFDFIESVKRIAG